VFYRKLCIILHFKTLKHIFNCSKITKAFILCLYSYVLNVESYIIIGIMFKFIIGGKNGYYGY